MTEHQGTINLVIPSEVLLEEMVMAEAKMRNSDEYIERCDAVAHIPDGWLDVTRQMQIELVTTFAARDGFENDLSIELALHDLRTAHLKYPNNPLFKDVPVYVRENKAQIGKLCVRDPITDVRIIGANGEQIVLTDLLDDSRPNIVFAGSHT